MHWVTKVQNAIDYREENLLQDVTPESVGRAIHYSPSSFVNLFSALTGYSIGEYIRFRRLSRAAEELADARSSVTDVSIKYGYETVEVICQGVQAAFQLRPIQVRRRPPTAEIPSH